MSLQIWVDKYGVYVWLSDLHAMEHCSLTMQVAQMLSCNFCGRTAFLTQEDLRRHLYMCHLVMQCQKEGCHRLLNDIFSRNFHEKLHHPEMTSGCACVCVCVCACM